MTEWCTCRGRRHLHHLLVKLNICWAAVHFPDTVRKQHPLFDLFLHGRHSLSLRVLKPVGGATEIAQHIMTLVVQEDVLHLQTCKT